MFIHNSNLFDRVPNKRLVKGIEPEVRILYIMTFQSNLMGIVQSPPPDKNIHRSEFPKTKVIQPTIGLFMPFVGCIYFLFCKDGGQSRTRTYDVSDVTDLQSAAIAAMHICPWGDRRESNPYSQSHNLMSYH